MTDHHEHNLEMVRAARRIWGESAILPLADLERFWAIAFRQGMERAAEIAIDLVAFHGGSVELEAAIRAHAQNQPKNVHDGSVMYKK